MHTKKIVEKGYDQIASQYNSRRLAGKELNYKYFDKLAHYFPKKGKLLDLGCGGGIPVTSYFSDKGFDVTGVDISTEMIEIARHQIPNGKFYVSDMSDCEFKDEEFDVIVSAFAIIHVPQDQQLSLFKKIFRWLRRGGVTYFVLGSRNVNEGVEDDWHGVKMVWSTFNPEEYREIIKEAGFNLLWDELEDIPGDAIFYNVVLAKNKTAP